MTIQNKIKALIAIVLVMIISGSCKNENSIDKYKVNLDSLETLPNNFYVYRGGRIYLEDIHVENYRIWVDLHNGEVQSVFKIEDFRNRKSRLEDIITTYAIDTSCITTCYGPSHLLETDTTQLQFFSLTSCLGNSPKIESILPKDTLHFTSSIHNKNATDTVKIGFRFIDAHRTNGQNPTFSSMQANSIVIWKTIKI